MLMIMTGPHYPGYTGVHRDPGSNDIGMCPGLCISLHVLQLHPALQHYGHHFEQYQHQYSHVTLIRNFPNTRKKVSSVIPTWFSFIQFHMKILAN